MYDGAWSPGLYCDCSSALFDALQAHGSAETAPSRKRHEQRFRKCQAATAVATYMQMQGLSTATAIPCQNQRLQLVKKLRQHQMQQSPVACPDRALPPVHAYQGGQDLPHLQVSQWH